MDIIKVFANNVKEYRLLRGLSQEAFAEKAGLHRTYISAVEREKRSISLDNIQKIAEAPIALLVTNMPGIPLTVSAHAISEASESRKMERPKNGRDSEMFDEWRTQLDARKELVETAQTPIAGFAGLVSDDVLSGVDGTNRVWSPISMLISRSL